MKNSRKSTRILNSSIATFLALSAFHQAQAVDGTWAGATGGTWHTITNWTPNTSFPGDATAVVAGEGLSTDIAIFNAANTSANVGLNMNTMGGGLSLGAIDMNRTTAGNLQIGNNSTTVNGVLTLNGATVNAVANTLVRVTGTVAADLTIANVNTGTTTQTMGVRLGITNGLFTVDTGRTLSISSIISQLNANSGFTKNGVGTVSLSGANTYNGTVLVTDGVLRISNATALGTGTSAITVTNADASASNTNEIQITGGITVARNLILENTVASANARSGIQSTSTIGTNANTWSGSITFKGGSNQTMSAGSSPMILSGALINDVTTPSSSIFFRGTNTGTVSSTGTINLGAANLFKTDTGTWILNNTVSAISGTTQVADGILTVGANNALSTTAPLIVGQGSGTSGTLNIASGISQTIASLSVAASSTGTQRITGPGALDTGGSNRTYLINDSVGIPQDLIIGAPITGSGGFTKTGAGTLAVNSAVSGASTISAGRLEGAGAFNGGLTIGAGAILSPGTDITTGSVTSSSIAFGTGATTLNLNIGTAGEVVGNTGGITASGTTTINFTPSGSLPLSGTVDLITHNGSFAGTAGFVPGALPGRVTGGLVNTGTAIALNITGNSKVVWTGAGAPGTTWDIAGVQNWKLHAGGATNFLQGDDLIFDNGELNTTAINLSVAANPARADFQNTVATAYTIVGTGGMGNSMILDKTADGLVTLAPVNAVLVANGTAHTYVGATNVNNGTLTLDYTGLTGTNAATARVISPLSAVAIGGPATLKVQRNNVATVFANDLTGSGRLLVDVNSGGTTGAQNFTLSGNNSAFTGTIKLSPTGGGTTGTFRTINAGLNGGITVASAGGAFIDVDAGAQLWASGATFTNNLTITGAGFTEAGGGAVPNAALQALGYANYAGTGAIRMETGSVFTGGITLEGSAKIQALNNAGTTNAGTATISGNITNTAATDVLVVGGASTNATHTLILTGDNSGLEKIWVNSSGSGGTAAFDILQIGNNGTTGTLGTGNVTLHADAARGAGIRFSRTDGYTLGAGQNILPDVAAAADHARLRLFVNSTGTGLTINNHTIDLSDGTNGGQISVAGNDGVNGVTGAIFNINGASSLVDAGNFYIGDAPNASGTVNQTDGVVNATGNIRIGHYPTNTSNYNLSGGTINATGTPAATPSNTTEQNGGIYLGIDGTGNFTQNGGIVNTSFVVLDNRGATAAGTNMPTGIDTYTLTSGNLNLKSQWGVIARNPTSTLFTLNGGTIANTAVAGTAVALDTPITVGASGGTIDTSANATSSVAFMGSVTGAGNAITLTGSGKLTFNPNSKATLDGTSDGLGTQAIAANLLSGTMPVEKVGTGTTTLTGAANTYSGTTTVTAGTLAVTGTLGSTAVTVNTGGTFAPGGNIGAGGGITLNAGGTLNVGGNNVGNVATTISAGSLTLGGGTVNLDFTGTAADRVNTSVNNGLTINSTPVNVLLGPSGWVTGTYPVYTYAGAVQGTGATALANATPTGHSTVTFTDDAAGTITMNVTGVTNKWVGGTGGFVDTWDINTTTNWNAGDQKYLNGDAVLFDDTASNFAPNLVATASPGSVNFANVGNNYTVVGAFGIAGATQLSMNGGVAATTATLAPVNAALAANASLHTYTGNTNVNSGTLVLDYTGLTGTNAATARVINSASAVSVAAGATLKTIRGDAGFTFSNPLSGAGTVELNAHAVAGGVVAHAITLNGANTGFTGTLVLGAPVTGTYRLQTPTQAALGSAAIDVKSGAQLFLGAGTYTNNLTIAGTGYADLNGNIGALRIDGTTYTGNIVVDVAARIGSHGSTGTISGIISGGDLTVNATNYNTTNYTTIFTGANTYRQTIIGGQATGGTGTNTMRLNIGNGGTTGTLGTGNVTINGDGMNGVLGFDRSNGYTLAQTITSGGSNLARTFVDIDTLGAGFNSNGFAINLGTAVAGGNLRVGQARAGAIGTINGSLTGANVTIGTGANLPGASLTFASGANVAVNYIGVAPASTNASLTIAAGATVSAASNFFVGEQNGFSGTVNQTGGGVTVGAQVRIGHWPNETSSYTLSGAGTLTTIANPGLVTNPAGGAEQNGGIYVGIDGTGIINQSGTSTVTTDWVVLDNRGNTPAGTNQPDGIDRYNLSGGTLEIRGAFGINNLNTSTEFNFTGGTIKNVGTGVNAAISGVGNFVIGTGGTGTPTIDTNGATNAFSVSRAFTGAGNLTKISNGALNLNAASPAWTGNLSVTGGTVATGAINGGLGSFTTASRTISASGGSIIIMTVNNVFGNGVGNPNLPSISLDGATLTSNRYNAIGDISLSSGAILTQEATDGPGAYEGYQFRGNVTVGGTSASSITATTTVPLRANHLGPNTLFSVGETNTPTATDLLVSAALKDQSADFGSLAGSLTKAGPGTMELTAANTYTGTTQIDAGTLRVDAVAANGVAQPLGTATSAILIGSASEGTLEYSGGADADLQRSITVNGAGNGVLGNSTAGTTLTLSGTLTKNGNTLTLHGPGKFKVDGLIVGALPNSDLVVDGADATLTNAGNSYTGPTRVIHGGTVTPTSNGALGALGGAIDINDASTLKAGGNLTTNARTVTLGTGGGKIDTNGNTVTLDVGSTVAGSTLTKLGAGKLVLAGTQTYATLDTEAGRTDIASALGTGTSSIIANAETNISVDQTLASLTIGNGAVVSLGAPLPPAPAGAGEVAGFVADFGGGDLAGAPIQGVPEPGSATLLFGGILTLLGLRRRR